MCETCGCTMTSNAVKTSETVAVLTHLLDANDRKAAHNREHFNSHGVLALNLMSSPGAGKTMLLEATIEALKDEFRIGVIEGDLETDNDAKRIRARGVSAIQITTGSACHLDAHMVHDVLHELPMEGLDILFIENVGNLVCPASFDLGQHRNVALLSLTEGDDKPAKYPVLFRAVDLVLLTKFDLAPVMDDFDAERAVAAVRGLANPAPVFRLSARRRMNLDPWFDWVRTARAELRPCQGQGVPQGEHRHDHSAAVAR